MRLLQSARLSRLGDASTGLDKQDGASTRYADMTGSTIVATAPDTDVSGSVSPWKRPKLGPWITRPELMAQYDGIIASALDRFGRNARHLSALRDWAEDNGKVLIVVSPAMQWPPEPDDIASPIIWDLLGRLAEAELKSITKRSRETQTWLKANDFLVGRAPYGYRIVTVDGSEHKTLEEDPETAPVVREIIARYLAGATLARIERDYLHDILSPADYARTVAVPPKPPLGTPWSPKTISQVMRNPILTGRRKDANGRTVLRVPPIVDLRDWNKVQTLLDSRAHRKGVPSAEPAMLTGILFCAKCDGPMYRIKSTARARKDGTKPADLFYYRCHGTPQSPSKCANMLPVKDMDARIDDAVMVFGWADHTARTLIPGDNHDAELAEIRQDIRDLDIDDPDYDDRLSVLRAEYARLRSLPDEPDRYEEILTGQTIAQHWAGLDDASRRAFLLTDGWTVHAGKDAGGTTVTIKTERDYGTTLEALRALA